MMLGFYQTLNCTMVSVKNIDSQDNFNKISSIYTKMCPSLTEGLPSEEMRGYGVNIPSEICLGKDSCWLCHNP